MSARSSREGSFGPEAPEAPSFTCEVCKISVRSAQKLLDHVNFSPLHKAALENGHALPHGHSPAKGRSAHRRILYDGTKLFWRINETLELCIFEDTGADTVTISGVPQQETASPQDVVPLVLERRSVLRAAAAECASGTGTSKSSSSVPAEVVTKYLLARLQAQRESVRGRPPSIGLVLQKLRDDELEPTVVASPAATAMLAPTDLAVRRRHTFDDVKSAQKEVTAAAVELKKARVQAENLSNLARLTLEAFSKRGGGNGSGHGGGGGGGHERKSEWLRVYDRVALKSAVEHHKDLLLHPHGSSKQQPHQQ